MQDLILTLHIIVCVILVILILLQSGKEGMGVIFGGGNSSVFGSAGAGGILAKLTTLMAIIFVITSLSYTYVTSSRPTGKSTILDVRLEDMPPPASAPKEAEGVNKAAPTEAPSGAAAPSSEATPADAQDSAAAQKNATPQPDAAKTPGESGAPGAEEPKTSGQSGK